MANQPRIFPIPGQGAPTEPVTLAQAKAHLRVTDTYDDAYIQPLITSARQAAEAATGRAIVVQHWRMFFDTWPAGRDEWWDGVREGIIQMLYQFRRWVNIPYPPLLSIDQIVAYDDGDVATVMQTSAYYVDNGDAESRPGRAVLRNGAVWPVAIRCADAVQIDFTAGYDGTTWVLPTEIYQGILMMVAWQYRNRGDGQLGNVASLSGALPLLEQKRVVSLGH